MPNPLTKSWPRLIGLVVLMIGLFLIGRYISVPAEIALATVMIIADTVDLLERS